MIDKNKYLNETIKNILQDGDKNSHNNTVDSVEPRSVLNILMNAAKQNVHKKKTRL